MTVTIDSYFSLATGAFAVSNLGKVGGSFHPALLPPWFTTHLRRTGMPREHVQELRGDSRPEAIDIYIHIGPEDLRTSYLAHMPRLGI